MNSSNVLQKPANPYEKLSKAESIKLKKKRILIQNIPLLIMFVPIIVKYILFQYIPMTGLVLAFKDYSIREGILGSPWIGLDNFKYIFSTSRTLHTIFNTFFLSIVSLIFGFPFPILFALLLNEVRNTMFKKTTQTLIYLPHFFNWVIVGTLITTIFNQSTGVVNNIIEHFTGSTIPFMYQPRSWIAIFIGSGIWKEAGYNAIIYLAAITNIDIELYEAARVDGASKFRQIWNITIPGILPTISLVLILSIGRLLNVGFDQVYNLENSAVSSVSEVISTYSYRVGVLGAQFGVTTAMGFFNSVVGFILVMSANRIAKIFDREIW